ncbi:MAG: hypothetical protein V2A74_08500, partial [bacterium]
MTLSESQQPLRIALLFHMNQSLTPFAQIATENCYKGLFRVLRNHRRSHFNLHVSGTLLSALQWYAPKFVEELRRASDELQIEFLGSTYSQNVMYSTPLASNKIEVQAHREALEEVLGVSPKGFWNSERCWRPDFVSFLSESGYRYTLIEDQILQNSGCRELGRPRILQNNHREPRAELTVFTDHNELKHLFNLAAWTGNPQPLENFLRGYHAANSQTPQVLCYAEDAEAMGLWGYERGVLPQVIWAQMDAVLEWLGSQPWIRIVTFGEALEIPALKESAEVKEGQASWMLASLRDPH